MNNSKVFRCPIHDLIEFKHPMDDTLIKIINSNTFQRLRRIRQLGLASLTYPSAVHDRFSHSLGVCHIVGKLVSNLDIPNENEIEIETSDGTIKINREQLKLLLQ